MDSHATAASACSSVEDRYASLREATSTHSVLSVGVSCIQREATEMEVVRDDKGQTKVRVKLIALKLCYRSVKLMPSVYCVWYRINLMLSLTH